MYVNNNYTKDDRFLKKKTESVFFSFSPPFFFNKANLKIDTFNHFYA